MADQIFPTKGNLLALKKSLALARLGFELLDVCFYLILQIQHI